MINSKINIITRKLRKSTGSLVLCLFLSCALGFPSFSSLSVVNVYADGEKSDKKHKDKKDAAEEVKKETIEIRTVEELQELSSNCTLDSWSKNKEVVLKNDLDLDGVQFTPIPLFAGSFNGNGHTIRNLKLSSGLSYAGLFRQVLPGAEIRYLLVEGEISGGRSDASEFVGGIAGVNYGSISYSSFTGSISGFRSVGGIAGKNSAEGLIESCTVSGSVEAEHRSGGIAGESDGIIRQCMNQAEVNVSMTEPQSGGLLSGLTSLSELSILDLTKNLSQAEQSGITDLGGICGFSSGIIRDSMNSAAVGHSRVGYNVGGIAGYSKGLISGCMNSGIVNGRNDVGGITGQIDPDVSWSFSTEKIDGMRERLNAVRDNIDKLALDAEDTSKDLSRDLTAVMASLDDAGNALEDVTNETVDFVNANIDTVNAFSSRIHYSIGELGGVLHDFSGFTERFPGVFESLSASMYSLQQAVSAADAGIDKAAGSIGAATADVNRARDLNADIEAILKAYAEDPSLDGIRPLVEKMRQDASGMRESLNDAVSQILSLSGALSEFSNAGEPLAQAMAQTGNASHTLSEALTFVDQAEKHLAGIFDTLSRYDVLTFSHLGGDGSARTRLFASVSAANQSVQSITRSLNEPVLIEDAKAISDSLFELINYLLDGLTGTTSLKDLKLLRDVSEEEREDASGSVISCTNLGAVTGETNIGGIAGTMALDFSFDLNQEFNLSSMLTGEASLTLYSAVRDCTGLSVVTAMKNDAGGITGRMDYGAILSCQATGQVSAIGTYAGGICGYSSGIIKNCSSRAGLLSGDYMGGIAGQGHDIISCLSIPSFTGTAPFIGAVAGNTDEEGVFNGNYYTGTKEGAVNGFSFTGKAEEISYDELLKKSGESELFKSVVVIFLKDNEPLEQVSVDFGGRIETLPEVKDKNGKKWKWNDFDNTAIFNSMIVTGSYISPVTAIAYKDPEEDSKKDKDDKETIDVPRILLEGSFSDGESLDYVKLSKDEKKACLEKLPEGNSFVNRITKALRKLFKMSQAYDEENLLYSGTIVIKTDTKTPDAVLSETVSLQKAKQTLHLYAPENGRLFIQDVSGNMVETSWVRDKNYIKADIDSVDHTITYMYFKDKKLIWPYVASGCAGIILIVVIAVLAAHSKRKRILLENDSDERLLRLYENE